MKRVKMIPLLVFGLLPCAVFAQQGATLIANFDPGAGIINLVPFPNNLLFAGSTDGTLNIPPAADPTDPVNGVIQALNALDGFSTVAPIVATFSNGANSGSDSGIDPTTVAAGDTVRVFEVEIVNPFLNPGTDRPFVVERVKRELEPNADYIAVLSPEDETGKTVVIQPLRPLKPKTSYMVVLTNGIQAAVDGSPALPDQTYLLARYQGDHHRPIVNAVGQSNFAMLTDAQAQSLAQLQPLVHSQENAAAGQGIRAGDIVLSWTFTTQSIADVLEVVRAEAVARPAQLTAAELTTQDIHPPLAGIADIYTGTLQIPYFLEMPATPETWPVILTTFWKGSNDSILTRYNPMPVPPQPNLTIPLLITVPNAESGQSKPDAGWPVVIFQHGLWRNRTQMLAVADVLALAGFAVVAIDLPLHGVTDADNPFYNAPIERTFNLDLVDNETLMLPPDGRIDPSGLWYTNLSSLLTTRDNGRQAIADLFQLTATVPTLEIDENPTTVDFDGEEIHFVGHSTGGIAGVGFLALEQDVTAATIANAGGGLANLALASAATGPLALAALETVGIVPGAPAFQQFLVAFQTTVDAIDPINHAKAAADAHPIHMIEVVGSENSPPDQVVPNRIPGAPLSGTEPLARLMDLRPITTTTEENIGIRGIVRFTEGNHGSFLSPEAPPEETASPAATVEMQNEMAGFMESQGAVLPVIDPEVVQTMLPD